MTNPGLFLWVLFAIFVLPALAIDLFILNRKAHVVSMKEACVWVGIWVSLALIFNLGVYFLKGSGKALEFLTGYLVEESLSVDNLFVFILIFSYFKIPQKYQPRVLLWGVLGAVVMRAIFIVAGVALIRHFHWMIYVFGAFLILTAIKMLFHKEGEFHPEKNIVLRFFRLFMPVSHHFQEEKFFIKESRKTWATPLFVVLILIESSDLMFALDSVPAVIAITRDPFIVYTSNIFAILGLRSLYFVLAHAMNLFRFLKVGVSVILAFVGVKMILSDTFHIPIGGALGVIALVLVVSILASVVVGKKRD